MRLPAASPLQTCRDADETRDFWPPSADEIAKPAADVKGKGKARAAVAYKDESDEYKSEDEKPAKKKKKTAKAKAPKVRSLPGRG